MSDPAPVVGVLAASPAELTLMQQAAAILEKLEIAHEVRVMSSPRNPDLVDEYARTAFERGLKAVICTTGAVPNGLAGTRRLPASSPRQPADASRRTRPSGGRRRAMTDLSG